MGMCIPALRVKHSFTKTSQTQKYALSHFPISRCNIDDLFQAIKQIFTKITTDIKYIGSRKSLCCFIEVDVVFTPSVDFGSDPSHSH